MWTKSIVRMPGLLVHAVTGVQKTNLRFNTDTDAVPFVLSPDMKHVDLNWDVPQVVLFFQLSTLWRVGGTLEAVLVTGVRTTTSGYLDLVSTVGGEVGSTMWAGTCHTAIPFIGWAVANWFSHIQWPFGK